MTHKSDIDYLRLAITLADKAKAEGNCPFWRGLSPESLLQIVLRDEQRARNVTTRF
jgi:hypothetical protein